MHAIMLTLFPPIIIIILPYSDYYRVHGSFLIIIRSHVITKGVHQSRKLHKLWRT